MKYPNIRAGQAATDIQKSVDYTLRENMPASQHHDLLMSIDRRSEHHAGVHFEEGDLLTLGRRRVP